MNPQTRKQYAIIVHYGAAAGTREALAALADSTAPPELVVVIDHAKQPLALSGNGTFLIRPLENRGYAAGINLGLGALVSRGARPRDIIIIMNNDILVQPRTLQRLRQWWEKNPAPAIVGTTLQEGQGVVSAASSVSLLTGRARIGRPSGFLRLPYLHGAFLAAPFSVWLRAQGLPEKYFLYWEDAAVSQRVRRQGVALKVCAAARVNHRRPPLPAVLADPAGDKRYYLIRNGALFMETATPLPWRWYWRVANRARLLYHRWHAHEATVEALTDARRGRFGPRPNRK